jgi:hypothetical protein
MRSSSARPWRISSGDHRARSTPDRREAGSSPWHPQRQVRGSARAPANTGGQRRTGSGVQCHPRGARSGRGRGGTGAALIARDLPDGSNYLHSRRALRGCLESWTLKPRQGGAIEGSPAASAPGKVVDEIPEPREGRQREVGTPVPPLPGLKMDWLEAYPGLTPPGYLRPPLTGLSRKSLSRHPLRSCQ